MRRQDIAGSQYREVRGYNTFNQVTQIQTQVTAGQIVSQKVDLNYGYGAGQNNGQVTSVDSGVDPVGFNATYTYDALDRLTGLTGLAGANHDQTYTYDGWGNLSAKSGSGKVFTSLNAHPMTNRLSDPNPNHPVGTTNLLRSERKHDGDCERMRDRLRVRYQQSASPRCFDEHWRGRCECGGVFLHRDPEVFRRWDWISPAAMVHRM